jgi:homoserine kinase
MEKGTIKIPAMTANLGPGFDVLGLALDLWNQIEFELKDKPSRVEITGEGSSSLPTTEYNLILRSVKQVYDHFHQNYPLNLVVKCHNNIPIFSGLGSSAAAVLAGVLIGNNLLGDPLSDKEVLEFSSKLEGHPDNIAPAVLGGLTISIYEQGQLIVHRHQLPDWKVIVILPDIRLSTHEARKALPLNISYADAIYNLGRLSLVVDALRDHDIEKLQLGMKDRIHEKYRLPLINGAEDAIFAARELGAAAAISGAGPSLITFAEEGHEDIQQAMMDIFVKEGINSRVFILTTTNSGAGILFN